MIAEPQLKEHYLSVEEFWALASSPEYAERNIELVEGVIVEMGHTGGEHAELMAELSGLLRDFVRPRRLGRIAAGDAAFVVQRNANRRDTVRGIDVAFVAMERAPEGLPKGVIPFAPDVAIEIVSPGNDAADMHKKVMQLLAAGTKLVLLVYPTSQTVVAHTSDGARTYTLDESIDFGDALPGFVLAVREVFAV
jgi:Uma2 family endonuclease